MDNNAIFKELAELLTSGMSASDIKAALVTSDISAKITKARIERNLSQKQFAEFMGVSQAMISKWESGDYNFTIASLSKIFDKLNMDFDITISKPSENNSTFLSLKLDSIPDYTDSKLTQLYCCA